MSKPLVLCVDDDHDNLIAVQTILKSEFEVEIHESALEALKSLKKQPDRAIIISDQRMSEINGVEFLERTLEINPSSVRILFTGYSSVDAAIEAINRSQIYRYMTKPWEPADLILTVKEAYKKYQLSNELKSKNAQLKKALSELQDMDKVKTNFMVLVNHELKTPLTTLSSYLELLKEEPLSASSKKYVERMQESYQRLKFLTDEVIHLLNDSDQVMKIAKQDLAESNILEIVHSYKNNENFNVVVNTNEYTVAVTEKILKNVIERLTHNALKFKSRGKINLIVEDRGDDISFEIKNYSPSFNSEDLSRILEPFELKGNIMNHSQGLGLGLPIVQVLLKKVGSELLLDYKAGQFQAQFVVRKRPLNLQPFSLNFA